MSFITSCSWAWKLSVGYAVDDSSDRIAFDLGIVKRQCVVEGIAFYTPSAEEMGCEATFQGTATRR